MTRAVASELQMDLADAARWKETQAAIGSTAPGAQAAHMADVLSTALQPTVRELRATLKAFTARSRRTVGRVYLCGGTSRLPGLDQELGNMLGIPSEMLNLPSEAAGIPA